VRKIPGASPGTPTKIMNLIKIKCSFCGKKFFRPVGRVNEAKKFGWKQFCSTECLARSKMNGRMLICANPNCRKRFYRTLGEIKEVEKNFCSRSWFYERKIKHQREVSYPENRLLLADFAIGNNLIEYFGLNGISEYDELIKEKRMLCKKYKLPLIEIYPRDLFPVSHLSKIIEVKNK